MLTQQAQSSTTTYKCEVASVKREESEDATGHTIIHVLELNTEKGSTMRLTFVHAPEEEVPTEMRDARRGNIITLTVQREEV